MFVASFAALAPIFFRAGPPPCSEESSLYLFSQLLVPIACFVSTVWLGVLVRRPNGLRFLAALALPGVAMLLPWGLGMLDAQAQHRCEVQTLTQAEASCGIDPRVYRAGRDQYGFATLTLVAPGTTDRAHACLSRWAQRDGSITLQIDESVYAQYRARAANPTTPPPAR
jgi:hypothetical protein